MGEEIPKVQFQPQDYETFGARMRHELELLRAWQRDQLFDSGPMTTGLELEAWLLDSEGNPVPDNGQFLDSLSSDAVVPELAQFNFEINVEPQPIAGLGLQRMQQEMTATWQACGELAAQLNRRITCIGILPTVPAAMLCVRNMTPRARFAALNRQAVRMRHGEPIRLAIEGIERLEHTHQDVMLEAAATSLQVHLKVQLHDASRYFNAFVIASAATVAMAANAPILFGKRLWHDSRISVFEQAVDTGPGRRRVSFGEAYAPDDFLTLFDEKVAEFPALLPVELPDFPERVPHLRMHNGTLWSWNRPIIGFEADGRPHIRIEHRVMSAGPTSTDMFANVALSLGLAHALANLHQGGEQVLPQQQCEFAVARSNFYAAAQHGLNAQVQWLGRTVVLRDLLLDEWLPAALSALADLQVDARLIEKAKEVLVGRIESGQTAAVWQLKAFDRHAGNVHAILKDYLTHQATKRPVHEWEV